MGRHKKDKLKTDEERMPVSIQRINAIKSVYNDMCDAAPYSVLAEKLQKDIYGVGKKYSDNESYAIIAQARKLLQSDFKDYCKDAREQIWLGVMDLATDSKEMGDRATALKCFQYIGKLLGVEEAQKYDVKLDGNVTIDFGI